MHHWEHPAWHTNMSLLRLPHSFSHVGLQVLSCLHTTRPLAPHLSTQVIPPKGMCSRCPHSHFLPHFHSMNMHLTVTNSFFWCLSDVFLLNLKWHFPACFLSLSLLSAAFTNQKTWCLQGLRCSTTLSATFSLLWSLALPHSISQHRFCCFSLSHSPDLIASTSRSPSKITIWHWFPFQQLF